MKSSLPKVLHPVANLPIVCHVANAAQGAGVEAFAIVTGNQSDLVRQALAENGTVADYYEQTERLGTAHAVLAARPALEKGFDEVLVLFGDTPLLTPDTLNHMRQCLSHADVAVLGFHTADPTGYGRLIIKDNQLQAIREEREASGEEKKINFCNGGIMAISGNHCLELVSAVDNKNAKGEYYLTDIVEIACKKSLTVVAHEAPEAEILGVNTRAELAKVERLWQQNRRHALMLDGVSMQAPETVFLSHDTTIGKETRIEPFQYFGPGVKVGEGVTLHAHGHYQECDIGHQSVIGPYARLRPGTELGTQVKIGNFVEVKKAKIADKAKVNHLTYIGDATIGNSANIGAGTITCNYDGVNKHLTEIGAGAFIGSNSALVAPVKIGEGSYVGSGSVVTTDSEADSLVIARAPQVNKAKMASRLRRRALAYKEKLATKKT